MNDAPPGTTATGLRRAWPRSVRARLALWFALGLLLVVSAYAAAVLAQVRDDLYEALDSQLEGDVALVTGWLRQAPAADPPGLAMPMMSSSERTGGELPWLETWSGDGRRLSLAGPRPELPPMRGALAPGKAQASSVRLSDGRRVRALVTRATIGDRTIVVRVGRSEQAAQHELQEFTAALVFSLPLAFVIAAGAGYWLAGRALAPVSEMTARARRITAEHLGDRLPVEDPRDEFGQLATVINDALARLEHSFDTLRRFTADASHELRTPLTAIRSVGEIGLRERRSEADYREIVGSLLEEAERLTTLVDGLLMLSRADAGRIALRPIAVDLRELAQEVVADFGVLAEEKHQRLLVDGETAVLASADRGTLRQALINLVDNAIKYSPDERTIVLRVVRRDSEAVIEVADDGPGIEPSHLPRIFDRFYRVDEARSRAAGGAGLGLSLARWAVEANGGRLTVESSPGRGSVFSIVLPALERSSKENGHRAG